LILALAFIATTVFFGYAASRFFEFLDDWLERVAFALFFGFLCAGWIALVFSWLVFESLGVGSIFSTMIVLLAFGGFLFLEGRKRALQSRALQSRPVFASVLALVAIVVLVYAALNFSAVLFDNERGGWSAVVNVWGDYPLHVALINSFVLRDNFPPQYPVLVGSPLAYPFLTDFFTSVLVKSGFGLREAIWFSNVALFFSLVVFLFFLAKEFSSSKKIAGLALLFFLFNGNAGVLNAFSDALKNPSVLLQPPQDYSHDEPRGLFFMNVVYAVFVPERSALFGFTAAVLIYLLLWRNAFEPIARQRKREFLLAGILFGLLPLTHAHSFLAVGVVAAFLFFNNPTRAWLYFILPTVLSVPQLVWMSQQVTPAMITAHLGWIASNETKTFSELVGFWLANGWIALVLSLAAFAFAKPRQLVFFAPFLALFFAGNVLRFQPWDWDNFKVFMHWGLFASILAALVVVRLWRVAACGKKVLVRVFGVRVFGVGACGFRVLAVVLVVLAIGSGVLSMLWMSVGVNARFEVFSASDLRVADWIRVNTPANAVFLTSDAHNHLVVSIAGRRIVMGFTGWLWSHGLNYGERERDVKLAFASADCRVLRKYGVTHVFVSHFEAKLFPNVNAFESSPFFEKVFDESFPNARNYKVFKVLC